MSYSKAMIDELIKGHESTRLLCALLQESPPENNDERQIVASRRLVNEVMGSFSRALIALGSGMKLEGRRVDDGKKEKSGEKRMNQSAQRGAYRRKTHHCSWTRTIAKTPDDGHTWRKYGQKTIHSAQYPRSYFKCTHRFDQDCQALRQVQRTEEDPSLFVITYFGEHTCRDPADAIAYSLRKEDPCIIGFASHKQHPDQFSISKQEPATSGCLSSNYFELPEIERVEGCDDQLVEELVEAASDLSDMSSSSGLVHSSSLSLGWDQFMDDSLQFHDMYKFELDDIFR